MRLQARLREIRERHERRPSSQSIPTCGCWADWPCDAAKALDALETAIEWLDKLQVKDYDKAIAAITEKLAGR